MRITRDAEILPLRCHLQYLLVPAGKIIREEISNRVEMITAVLCSGLLILQRPVREFHREAAMLTAAGYADAWCTSLAASAIDLLLPL
jgi:hypothetical protein